MNKSKSSLPFHISQTEDNITIKSSKKKELFNSTLPSIRDKIFNEFFYESYVEKYNEKINLWQNSYLCVKKNYLYLYDKKPKLLDKPKEFLFLNNKITMAFHRKLFKNKHVKCYVVNFKINNDALSKSLIEDNNHNLFISFKSQKNYENFVKVIQNVHKFKQFTNSVSPNQICFTKKEIKNEKNMDSIRMTTRKKFVKNMSTFHTKNKSMNQISIHENLIFSDCMNKDKNKTIEVSGNKKDSNNDNEIIDKDNSPYSNRNRSMNSENKSNNSIHNVFTFSKVENGSNNTNDIKINNRDSTKNSNSNNRINNRINDLSINDNNIFLEKTSINNSKRNINYFTVKFPENYSKYKSNNIFDTEESSLTVPEIPKLFYSISRKKQREKEDTLNFKKQRTKSCLGFNVDNIFLQKDDKNLRKEETNVKGFHSFCQPIYTKVIKLNSSNYSRDSKNLPGYKEAHPDNSIFSNNTVNLSLTQTNELNNKEEEKNFNSGSKSKDKTNNSNNMSFGSLKSFKSDSKEGEETKNKDYFEGLNIYSYVDASETIKEKSISDNNPLAILNIPKIRNQITNVIKQNEEIISENNNEDSDVIFTPRLMEEIQQNEIITESNSNDGKKEGTNLTIDLSNNSQITKIDFDSDKNCSNLINTSITNNKKNLRFSNEIKELIQSLETKNQNPIQKQCQCESNEMSHKIEENNVKNFDLNNSNSNNCSNNNIKINKNNIHVNAKDNNDIINKSKSDKNNESYISTFDQRIPNDKIKKENKEKNIPNSVNENRISNKLSIPFNTFFEIDLSFYSFGYNYNSLSTDKSTLEELIYKIDNNLLFIYDSNILNLLLKKIKNNIQYDNLSTKNEIEGNITKNKLLGKIYESLNNKYVKYFILCEMIAIISKKELSKIIVNSIEVYNKKKEINPNEPMINFDEYIYDIFNKYLSRNENNKDYLNLYEKILPNEIQILFGLNDTEGSLINIIKNNIHPYTLFNSMQYHNKIYMNINLETNDFFDYNLLKPFNNKSRQYISPFILEKWKYKASVSSQNKHENNDNILSNNIASSINESFESNSINNYSRDMSNKSLSYILIDKENKLRVSLVSKFNNNIYNNNNICCDFNKKEKKIYEDYKLYEKTEEIQKINLFQNIIININQQEFNSAMKNCEYFLQKYQNSTLFLHPLIYLCLAIINNKIDGFDSAQKYIKKSMKYLTWLFPYQNCFLFYEIEYEYLMIILNNEENIIKNNIENITNIFAQCENLWKKYCENKKNSELKIHEIIFKIYFTITEKDKNNCKYLNDLFYANIKPLMNELEWKKENNKDKYKTNLNDYWKIFFEFFKNCPGSEMMIFKDLISFVSSVNN